MIIHTSFSADLAVLGIVKPKIDRLAAVAEAAQTLQSPWIGDHVAYTRAPCMDDDLVGSDYSIGYTAAPKMDMDAFHRITDRIQQARKYLGDIPLILENSPIYFQIPGNTFSQPEFLSFIARELDVGLLLDEK